MKAQEGGVSAGGNSGSPFDASIVRHAARDLAQKPFRPARTKLPEAIQKLSYDDYRKIRFQPAQALWKAEGLPFQAQFFHPGFIYRDKVDIFQVVDGRARPVLYSPQLFSFGEMELPVTGDVGFAGFRLHAPINRSDYLDEICAFLGASYFRAVGKDQIYGLSARGLAINTAEPTGEEFPAFRAFWLERPSGTSASMVVHALLDSESAAAAFRFSIRPGVATVFDVEMSLYPRVDLTRIGIAPLTSMFFFAAHDRDGIDDFRAGVHDSDGLAMWTGRDERLWRPLANPRDLQVSVFGDTNPRGFGLMQRQRSFKAYEDLEAHYERRPSAWVEPIGDWGKGAVHLVEIPTNEEIHDNIVAFWRPHATLRAKTEYIFNYRLHWCEEAPRAGGLGRIEQTRIGTGWSKNARLVVLDLAGGPLRDLPAGATLVPEVSTSKGIVANPVVQPNPQTGGWRLSFELPSESDATIELRARLVGDKGPLSETWLYRWTI